MTAEERDMDEAVWLAGSSGDFSKVWSCLRAKLDPNYRRFRSAIQESALHCAAWRGDEAAARRLLGAGARVYALDGQGRSAADIAKTAGHADLAQLFEAQLLRELGARAAAIVAAAAPGDHPCLDAAPPCTTGAPPASDTATAPAETPEPDAFVVDYYLVDSACSAVAPVALSPAGSVGAAAGLAVDASVQAAGDRASFSDEDEDEDGDGEDGSARDMGLWLRGEVWEAAGGVDWNAVQRAGARAVWSGGGSEGSQSSLDDPDEDPDGQEIDYGDEEDDRGLFGEGSSMGDDDEDDPFGSLGDGEAGPLGSEGDPFEDVSC